MPLSIMMFLGGVISLAMVILLKEVVAPIAWSIVVVAVLMIVLSWILFPGRPFTQTEEA